MGEVLHVAHIVADCGRGGAIAGDERGHVGRGVWIAYRHHNVAVGAVRVELEEVAG
jgi:hypothetical protein